MPKNIRQISLKECYNILNLNKGATLQDLKRAYRKRAFELHPDLNPGNPDAARQFQILNEAYVALSKILDDNKQNSENQKKNTKSKNSENKQSENKQAENKQAENSQSQNEFHNTENKQHSQNENQFQENNQNENNQKNSQQKNPYDEQNILRDLLNDPFAKRVFEDIYSKLNENNSTPKNNTAHIKNDTKKQVTYTKKIKTAPIEEKNPKGVKNALKGWLLKQIDEQQNITLPASGLAPGRRIRLQIRRGFSDEINEVEVTLPNDFLIGKPIRLRGLGKRVGPWQGDLYLTINIE